MASTPSVLAISGTGAWVSLKPITEVREMTVKAADHGEASDDRLGHAVGKIFLRRIARQAF
jgi:hypothetical protein